MSTSESEIRAKTVYLAAHLIPRDGTLGIIEAGEQLRTYGSTRIIVGYNAKSATPTSQVIRSNTASD